MRPLQHIILQWVAVIMRQIKFITNSYYHIYNRGVDGRTIFKDDKDYRRFIHSLYEFNDKQFALPLSRMTKEQSVLRALRRQPLVNILCFCLMPNHFHLILEQIVDSGITKFMRKLGTGYTMYFNTKYKRNGVLFQGKFKAIAIETDEYLLHLSRYIHLNPVELIEKDWKLQGIKDWNIAKNFLRKYRWSSFIDYIGIRNFPSVTQIGFIQRYFKNCADYKEFVEKFLVQDISKIEEILLEDQKKII